MPVDGLASMKEGALRIASLGVEAVLIKGGHLEGDAVDLLFYRGEATLFREHRIPTRNTHGTGCTFSACITAELARGRPLIEAVGTAKKYITLAIETAPGLGGGAGPVNHHARIEP
jgi:hydroxymethylpyrimidine/phosphomethylpyrimidine kinase